MTVKMANDWNCQWLVVVLVMSVGVMVANIIWKVANSSGGIVIVSNLGIGLDMWDSLVKCRLLMRWFLVLKVSE